MSDEPDAPDAPDEVGGEEARAAELQAQVDARPTIPVSASRPTEIPHSSSLSLYSSQSNGG